MTEAEETPTVSVTARSPVILVVEDDKAVCDALVVVLHESGFMAFPAGSVREAIDTLAAGVKPAAIILDINLPNGRGLDVARRMRGAAGKRPCFFINTGEYNQDWAQEFFEYFDGQLQGFWTKGDVKLRQIPDLIRNGMIRYAITQRRIGDARASAVREAAPRTGETFAGTVVRRATVKFKALATWEKVLPGAALAVGAIGAAVADMAGWKLAALTPAIIGKLLVGMAAATTAWYTARMAKNKGG